MEEMVYKLKYVNRIVSFASTTAKSKFHFKAEVKPYTREVDLQLINWEFINCRYQIVLTSDRVVLGMRKEGFGRKIMTSLVCLWL